MNEAEQVEMEEEVYTAITKWWVDDIGGDIQNYERLRKMISVGVASGIEIYDADE